MAKPEVRWVCQQCNWSYARPMGRCPHCGAWDSLVETIITPEPERERTAGRVVARPQPLSQVEMGTAERIPVAMREFSRVLGGGLVPGSVVLIGGKPGIGKSTLLLQVAALLGQTDLPVLYASGEESPRQIKMRAQRLGIIDDPLHLLAETDIEAIRAAPLVALLCLNHNRDPARLAREIFSLVRDVSGAYTFMDIGDPSSRPEILGPLVREVLCEGFVDILSVNENEVRWIARELGLRGKELTDKCEDPDEWLRCARFVAQETGSRVDLHTPFFSATLSSELEVVIPTFRVDVRVTCGAGDAWNAGDIFGTLLGISPDQRVVLANAVGALYVSSSEAEHPTLSDVEQFLRSNPSLTKLGNKLLKPP